MGSPAFRIDRTPNPQSLKITTDRALSPRPATFGTADAAASHPLAHALLSLPQIASVFMMGNFCTVTKRPEADWEALEPLLRRAFADYLAGDSP